MLVVSLADNLAWPVVRSLAAAGHDPSVLGLRARSPFTFVRECRTYASFPRVERTPSRAPDPVMLRDVARECRRQRVDVVMGADLDGVNLLADVATMDDASSTLVAQGPGRELIDDLHDKWTFSRRLETLGLPQPTTELAATVDDVRGFGGRYPIVVKPRSLSGGVGMHTHAAPADLGAETLSSLDAFPNVTSVVVQEHFGDWDIGYSFLATGGRVLAGALCRHRRRGEREFFVDERMDRIVGALLDDCGYEGVGHIDARYDSSSDRYALLELNPRFWASVLYSRRAGVNFPELLLQHTVGVPLGATLVRPGVVRLAPYERSTTLFIRASEALYNRRTPAYGS